MILHRRPNVRWSGISPEMVLAITIIKDIGLSMQLPVIITSCRDGKHSTKSKHYSGHAIDIAIRDYSEEQLTALVQHLQRNLGEDFDIVIEDAGGPNEHMHIEYDPKNLMLQKDNPPG